MKFAIELMFLIAFSAVLISALDPPAPADGHNQATSAPEQLCREGFKETVEDCTRYCARKRMGVTVEKLYKGRLPNGTECTIKERKGFANTKYPGYCNGEGECIRLN